jgi:predicted  nucleic acid-binding Zn-ribbon protein
MLEGGYVDFDGTNKTKNESPSKLSKNIDILTQRNEQLEADKNKLINKIERLKRNYDGLSNSTKNEKTDFVK